MKKPIIFIVLVVLAILTWWMYQTGSLDLFRNTENSSVTLGECYVGGCSGQICSDDLEGSISTCEYMEEYACYKNATCERQASGECGWTQTNELQACLGISL